MRTDIKQHLADYRGVLHWDAIQDYYNNLTVPAIDIELFIKESSVPMRKPRLTEINTIPQQVPSSHDSSSSYLFFGSPEPLTVSLSGWIITPTTNGVFVPKSAAGAALDFGDVSYADIISLFLEGRITRTSAGAIVRKDPDYYISPHGHRYDNPVIATWQPTYTAVMRKQGFSMTMYLES